MGQGRQKFVLRSVGPLRFGSRLAGGFIRPDQVVNVRAGALTAPDFSTFVS